MKRSACAELNPRQDHGEKWNAHGLSYQHHHIWLVKTNAEINPNHESNLYSIWRMKVSIWRTLLLWDTLTDLDDLWWHIQRCTAEKAPEPEPNSSDLDNSPDSEDMLGYLGRSIFLHIQNERFGNWDWHRFMLILNQLPEFWSRSQKFVSCPLQRWDESQAWGLRILATTLNRPKGRFVFD